MRLRPNLLLGCSLLLSISSCSKSKGTESAAADAGGAALAAQSPGVSAVLGGFEGEIGVLVQGAKRPGANPVALTLQVKGDRVRVDIPPGAGGAHPAMNLKGYAVLRGQEKRLSVVMDEQKQVLVLDLDHAADQLKSLKPPTPPGVPAQKQTDPKTPPKVTKLATTDKVAGQSCNNWEVTEEGRRVALLCIADEGASWFHLPSSAFPAEYAWTAELLDGKHLPLRAIGFEKDGTESGRLELTKLDKKSISPAVFEIPASYKVVDLATMIQQMMGMYRPGGPPGAPGLPPNLKPQPRSHP